MSYSDSRKELFRHRRSISQLMAGLEELNSKSGIENPALIYDDLKVSYAQFDAEATEMSSTNLGNGSAIKPNDSIVIDDSDVLDDAAAIENEDIINSRCLPEFQFSIIESEYDETLGFPDSVTILSNVGDKPVLVERKETDDDDFDELGGAGLPPEIPFNTIFGPNVKFNSFQRKVFIPGTEIQLRIVDNERSVTTHLLNPNLYTIELTHGPFTWTIKRRYKHFNSLHQQLSFFRTSLNIPFPIRSHKEKRATIKNVAKEMANEAKLKELQQQQQQQQAQKSNSLDSRKSQQITTITNGDYTPTTTTTTAAAAAAILTTPTVTQPIITAKLSNNNNNVTTLMGTTNASSPRKTKKKRKLPRFPNRPESLITLEALPTRIKQLEDYLYNLLNISLYRSFHETLNFVEVSNLSFVTGLGIKGKEGILLKRTGSMRPGQAGFNFFGCLKHNCCVRCNYFCSDVLWGTWRNRWFFVKETFFGYIRPTDGSIRSVMLFDQGFDVSTGIHQTGMRKGLQILTNNRHIILKCWTRRKCKEWMQYLKQTSNTYARDFTYPNSHMSYAPVRSGTIASWYVDGASYMAAVADALQAATEEIYIADWWLSPEIYMKRPAIDGDYWRLDKILHRKASQGVRIFVQLYKELEIALCINSYYSKQTLHNLHENIKVFRHPDHARAGVFLWAHHEKIVVVDQTYAFLGGLDLCYGRWDDHYHKLTDLGSISTESASGSTRRPGGFFYNKDDVDSAFCSTKSSPNHVQSVSGTPPKHMTHQQQEQPQQHEEIYGSPTMKHSTPVLELRTLSPGDKLIISDSPNSTNGVEIDGFVCEEGMKLNTPEMERKNVLKNFKDSAMKRGKDLVNLLTMHENERQIITTTTTTTTTKTSTSTAATAADTNVNDKTTEQLKGVVFADIAKDANLRKTDDPMTLKRHINNEFYGQAKYWYGKDYANFILKDWMNLDSPLVDIIDRTKTPRMPWHDVGVCVVGASARDVARHFIQRWNTTKLEKMRDNTSYPYLMPKSYQQITLNHDIVQKRQNRVTCQLLRSVSSWSCGFIEEDLYEQSIHEAYIQTIIKAQHYIYIENQFFISLQFRDTSSFRDVRNQIGETLFKRIVRAHKESKPFRVYVILPLLPGFEGDVGGDSGTAVRAITHWNYKSISRGRTALITRLIEVGIEPSNYISFHSLRNHSFLNNMPITELIYVHSKLLIADDRVVICGSANINDRSMIGEERDSEIAAIITDEEYEDGMMNGEKYPSGIFAGRLRKFLFKEHLGLLEGDSVSEHQIDVTDPVIDDFWHNKWRAISQANTEIYEEVFQCIPTNSVKSFSDLRKYQEETPLNKKDPELAAKKILKIQGHLVTLPLEFLMTENLTPPKICKEGIISTSVWI